MGPKQDKQSFQRERSFVETNFVQTPKTTNVTQILPPAQGAGVVAGGGGGSPALSTVILSEKMEEKIALMQLQQEIAASKEENRDLQEKLETLKVCIEILLNTR